MSCRDLTKILAGDTAVGSVFNVYYRYGLYIRRHIKIPYLKAGVVIYIMKSKRKV